MKLQDLPATVSIPQAEILGVGRDLAYRAARDCQLPAARVGRRLLVGIDELLELLGVQPGGAQLARRGHDCRRLVEAGWSEDRC